MRLSHRLALLSGYLVSGYFPLPWAQDVPAPGFALSAAASPSASPLTVSATLASGNFVVFDGLEVALLASDGTPIRSLGVLPAQSIPSFLVADEGEQYVCCGESSNGNLYRLSLGASGSPEFLANLPFNYDGTLFGNHLYVSAATCGFFCDNEIWRVSLDPPQVQARGPRTAHAALLARVPGASGPLVASPLGELFYVSVSGSFPPPPGHASVWRWSRSEIEGERLLGLADADLVGSGFEGGARLTLDPRDGSLFLAETNFATGHNRILAVRSTASQSPVLIEGRTFFGTGSLSFHAPIGPARFLPFQPDSGGLLTYTTTDFFAPPERIQVRPLRPQATLSVPAAGQVRIALVDGPPNGFARFFVGPRDLVPAQEQPVLVGGIPLFVGLDPATVSALPGFLSLNASGGLRLLAPDPGGDAATVAVQLLLFDSQLGQVATSTVAML